MNAKLIFGMGAVAIAVAVAASSAKATSLSAFAGQPQAPADYACFTNAFGSVRNDCATTKRYCVALPVSSSVHTIQPTVLAPNISHNIACEASAVNQSVSTLTATGLRSPSSFGVPQTLTLGTLSVPNFGALFLCCDLSPSSRLLTINY